MKVTLIIFFIGFLTIAPSIYFGAKLFDGKVTEKPYETGLEYNKIKDIIEKNGFTITDISAKREAGTINISFKIRQNTSAVLENISFYVSRPASNQDVFKLDAVRDREGYKASFSTTEKGNFILEVRAKVSGSDISFQKNFYTE